jgi:hypothetical protein
MFFGALKNIPDVFFLSRRAHADEPAAPAFQEQALPGQAEELRGVGDAAP